MNTFFQFEAIYCKIKSVILLPMDFANMMGLFATTMKHTTCRLTHLLYFSLWYETLCYAPEESGPTKNSTL